MPGRRFTQSEMDDALEEFREDYREDSDYSEEYTRVDVTIGPFTYTSSLEPLESKPKMENNDQSSTTPSIETFTINTDSEPIDIYEIIKNRSAINPTLISFNDSCKYWMAWNCDTNTITDCQNLYDNIHEKLRCIIFFIGFRTMIYGDHLHDFGSSKVYTSNSDTIARQNWSSILFEGCLADIIWFIEKQTKSSKSLKKIIINILKYLLLNQFMFWYTKTIKLSQIDKLSSNLKDSIKKKYIEQQAKICSITELEDYIKIFKYIDFCGYYCGKVLLYRHKRGKRVEDKITSPSRAVETLHDEMGKFISNWALKSIFCIYPKSLKNLLGCNEELLSINFIEQNKIIFDKIYNKSRPNDDKNTIIQLRIDQEGDTRNHLAIFNSITEYTRQYITCENINVTTNDDNTENIISDDDAALYIKKMLANKVRNNLGIIYDYAGWQDPGCTTLPRLRSDVATLYELQILVPTLGIEQIYNFAKIPIIKYTYLGPAQGCTYNQFFQHIFSDPPTLKSSQTSVNNITLYAKSLVGYPSNPANVITSNLTIKTFGDLNQCIIFGHYYGNYGFYKNENENNYCLPIFMTGDVISGYMSALISNQVITEKHDKSNTMRQHTRELVDGVIYYLNCVEKDNYNSYLEALRETLRTQLEFDVAAAVADDPTYLDDIPEVFDYICPDDPTQEQALETIEELIKEIPELQKLQQTLPAEETDMDREQLHTSEDPKANKDVTKLAKKRKTTHDKGNADDDAMGQGDMDQGAMGQGDMDQGAMGQGDMGQGNIGQGNMGQGKQTYKNRTKKTSRTKKTTRTKKATGAKKATGTKKIIRAKKATRTKKAKKNLKKTKNIKRR